MIEKIKEINDLTALFSLKKDNFDSLLNGDEELWRFLKCCFEILYQRLNTKSKVGKTRPIKTNFMKGFNKKVFFDMLTSHKNFKINDLEEPFQKDKIPIEEKFLMAKKFYFRELKTRSKKDSPTAQALKLIKKVVK